MKAKAKTIDQIERAEQPQPVDKRTEPKEFEIVREPSGLYRIKYTAGGEVPKSLKGRWTTNWRAEDALKNFLVTRKQQQEKQAAA